MKKILLLLSFLFCCTQFVTGQITAGGVLDNALDRKGNAYTLTSLAVNDVVRADGGYVVNNVVPTVTSGYFKLYLEPGCGMDDISDPAQLARLNVICSLCADLSNFIASPLTTSGQKVNVWVRNPANVTGYPFKAYTTSLYSLPAGAAVGGIADNVAWTTINSGNDAFANIAPTAWLTSTSGTCFHMISAFDFSGYTWNTDLSVAPGASEYDLYTIALGEFAHALGLNSLIANDGSSLLGSSYPWYSRYDLQLKSYSGVPLLTHTGTTPMMGYSFNPALSAANILSPFPGACMTDTSRCDTTVQYVGAATVPVYTPNCFEAGTSLSCFEDACFFAPSLNNQYFTASNVTNAGSMKRSLSKEERLALGDIGLSLGTTFGNASRLNYAVYSGGAIAGINVLGGNDGVATGGGVSYISDTATPDSTGAVIINGPGLGPVTPGLLANDLNADAFEDLTVLNGSGTFTATSGTATTAITYTPGTYETSGLKLISYVPYNTVTGQRGNVTYSTATTVIISPCTLPAITASTTAIIVGGTVVVSNTVAGGTWSIGPASAPYATIISTTSTSATIQGISAGTAIVTYTVGKCQVFIAISVMPRCLGEASITSTPPSLVGAGGTFSTADITALGSVSTCKVFYTNTSIVIASGIVTIRNSAIAIRPGTSITVMPGAKLILEGSHLFCCDSMWQGIKLSGTAQLEMYGGSTGNSSLIEDAYTAISYSSPATLSGYLTSAGAAPGAANRLSLYCRNAIFNKNNVGIAVSNYTSGVTSILNIAESNPTPSCPFYISGTVFTSRSFTTIPVGGLCAPFGWPYNWPRVLGGVGGLEDPIVTTPYNAPYQLTTLYAYSRCNDLSIARTGIYLKDVGASTGSLSLTQYWSFCVGNPLNLSGELTLFDTLTYGIDDTTSNLTTRSCAFINIPNTGINAFATSINHTFVYRLHVYGDVTPGVSYSNNLFYGCGTGVRAYDLYEVRSKYANMFSRQITTAATLPEGAYGFNMTGCSYYNESMHNDSMYNIRNGFVHNTYLNSAVVNLYGQICISKNLIAATYGGATPTNQFVKNGVILTGYAGYNGWALGGAQVNVDSNTIQNAYNGINITLMNAAAQKVTTEYNTLKLRKDVTVASARQAGIYETSNSNSYIDNNTITGPGATIPAIGTGNYNPLANIIEAIHVELATVCSLQCNNVSQINTGFYFGNTSTGVYWVGNTMANLYFGYVLSGKIGVQPGVALRNTGNTIAAGTITKQTLVTTTSTAAISSPMHVLSPSQEPLASANFAEFPNVVYLSGTSIIPHLAGSGYSPATCFAAPPRSTIAYRLADYAFTQNDLLAAAQQSDKFSDDGYQHAKQWIAQKLAYDQLIQAPQLAENSIALSKFMSLAANSRFKYVNDMMGNIGRSNSMLEANGGAVTNTTGDEVTGVKMADGSDVDFIVRNYEQYAHLYKAYLDGNFNERDQQQLSILAHKCPNTDGEAVYSARSLYGVVTSDYSIIGNGTCDSQALYTNGPDNTFHLEQGYDLFPNPNNGKITLIQHLAESQLVQAEIWNAVGTSTYKGQLQFAGGKANLQLNNCPPGMYVLQLLDEQGHRYAFKFTVN